MNLIEHTDSEMMALAVANRLAGDLNTALETRDRALLVVPGGSTPGPIFDVLCAARLDWGRVVVTLSDERWRPEAHIRSNTRLIRERLLVERAAEAEFVPLYKRTETPEEAIEELAAGLEPHLPVSVLLLGMGADMHTASLFPKGDRIEEAMGRDAPILVPMRVEGEPEPRVTLSARVLNDAMCKHLVITGDAKRGALMRAQASSPLQAPIAAFLEDMDVHWAAE
ncbi:6-phosphogluconolactonase [Roseovarius sp. SCSIO 43702]|uniref:6-phosphogluconolactonase n=1 Tax=Roseovarius sp. SCSIO 43702 TaxID=2823043 RepID=UPI001C731487|nr:6-phosphogluconolactonase [Roseovarius sp. SCSIO 43702]QYX55238.1 6-phosphogluconolactonase [Roseovarius sp. SCSIO 43702]